MKRTLGFLVLLGLLMTATGCNGNSGNVKGSNHFKEYEFNGTANQEQREKIIDGMQKNTSNLCSVEIKTELYSKSGSTKTENISEQSITFSEDSSKPDLLILKKTTSENNQSVSSGITLKQKTKTELTQWDGGAGYAFLSNKDTINKNITIEPYEIGTSSKQYKDNTIVSNISLPSSYSTYYTKSDGSYAVVSSNINKQVTGVQWGSGTKEYIVSSKSQTVYSITKDFKLISYYSYEESSTNRDNSTGEWFDSVITIYRSYQSVNYKYGKRSSDSITALNKTIADKTFDLSFKLITHTSLPFNSSGDGAFIDDSSLQIESSINVVTSASPSYTFRFTFSAPQRDNDGYRAQRFELVKRALHGADVISTKYDIDFTSDTIVGSSVYNYYQIIIQDGITYFINTETYSYSNLQVNVSFNGTRAVISSVNMYY